MHFTTYKLKLYDEDLANIKLEAFSENVCCWSTTTYMSNLRFVYHLWQNKRTLGCGHAYGDPKIQTPYCTHTYRSYVEYSKGLDQYYQFWFLRKLPDMTYELGDLTNKVVMQIYAQMKGKGFELLYGQNDSHYNLLDSYDKKIPCFYKCSNSTELNKLNALIVKKHNIKNDEENYGQK